MTRCGRRGITAGLAATDPLPSGLYRRPRLRQLGWTGSTAPQTVRGSRARTGPFPVPTAGRESGAVRPPHPAPKVVLAGRLDAIAVWGA